MWASVQRGDVPGTQCLRHVLATSWSISITVASCSAASVTGLPRRLEALVELPAAPPSHDAARLLSHLLLLFLGLLSVSPAPARPRPAASGQAQQPLVEMSALQNTGGCVLRRKGRPLARWKTGNDPPCCVVAPKLAPFWRWPAQESALVETGLNSPVASIAWPAQLAASV